MVKMPRCFKDANHIPPCKKPLNCPNQNDMKISKHAIRHTSCLQIYKQGSLVRHFRVFSSQEEASPH